jgi:hypothetical protein
LLNVNDANGEPLLLGRRVKIRGVATAGSGVYSVSNTDIYIQDATGGINVFKQYSTVPLVERGDKVEVEGFVDAFEGLTRITSPTIRVKAGDILVPPPVRLETGDAASGTSEYEGSLVELSEVTLTSGTWPPVGSDGSVMVDDGSGECEVFIDADTGIPGLADIPDTFDLVGILAQHDASFPFLSGFRVMPRSREDIKRSSQYDAAGSRLVARVLPMPAKRSLRIVFTRGALDHSKHVSLYDVAGRKVAATSAPEGSGFLDWVPRDDSGRPLAGGIYFASVTAGGTEETLKIVIVR